MNLLFLGHLSLPESFFLPYLGKHGYDLTIINTDQGPFLRRIPGTEVPVDHLYEESKLSLLFKGQFGLLTKPAFYDVFRTNRKLTAKVSQIIKQRGIEVVYGSWGSYGLPEFRLLQRFKVPTIYEFLAYPVSRFGFAVEIENFLNKSVVQGLTGRVFATQRMLGYMINRLKIRTGRNTIFAESYPKKCFYSKRLQLLSKHDDQRHLLFLGLDAPDILPQMEQIAKERIHVHFPSTNAAHQNQETRHQKFIHAYEHFNHYKLLNGEFGTFMTQFDACLVTYNFSRVSCLDKFRNSIPARFSFALTGGIPIVMPRGYFDGCEEIITKHQIGFTYTNYKDLATKLNNRELMDEYRRNAVKESERFTLENNFGIIDTFIKEICNSNAEQNRPKRALHDPANAFPKLQAHAEK
jgi:hypothetical protein